MTEIEKLVLVFRNAEDITEFLARFSDLERDDKRRFLVGNLIVTWEQNLQ